MLKKLLVLSFIEGAVVMAVELCGARLLAPIYGSSLYVWAAVMGITLAALGFGYFFGGSLSESKRDPSKTLFWVLSTSALWVLLMPVLGHYAIPRISYLPFSPAVIASTLCLLFVPVFLLGASSPLFIFIQSQSNNGGRVSGTVYAVSTAGGILATFLCGFVLIPQMGLTACLLLFGGLLLIATTVVFKIIKPLQVLLLLGFVYLSLQFSFKKNGALFVSDSLLGHLEVKDIVNINRDSIRILKINEIIQTEMSLVTHRSVSDYIQLLDTLIEPSHQQGHALVLGLGGGLAANVLCEKNYVVDGVELDARIIDAAKKYFYLNSPVKAVADDARYFLNHCHQTYDLVLFDVFKAEEQPSHVLTLESLQQLKHNLSPSARVYVNWHGYLAGDKGLGTALLYNTFLKAGYDVKLCAQSVDENYRNIVFVAALHKITGTLPYELIAKPAETPLVNTDNAPLLEKYNAAANKAWRANYLRYYQDVKVGS